MPCHKAVPSSAPLLLPAVFLQVQQQQVDVKSTLAGCGRLDRHTNALQPAHMPRRKPLPSSAPLLLPAVFLQVQQQQVDAK
jgi:hypothetical protein